MMPIATLRHLLMVYCGACLVTAAAVAVAQAPDAAGRFLSASGDVRVIGRDGASRAATRTTEVREGETIVTGPNALGQLRMADGALMSIRADTEMKLDRFAYSGKEDDPNASFLMSIVKGGFRTITGFIGRANRNAYRVQTPTATIGVRGTDYELVHITPQTARGADPGTYNRVYEGVTSIQNAAGVTLLVSRDQTAFAGLQGTTPVLVTPPASIFGRPTPPPAAPRSQRQEEKGRDRGEATARPLGRDPISPVGARPALLNPLDSPRVITPIETAPALDTTRVLSPIQTAPTTTLTAPTTVIAPTTTIDSTLTTTIQTAPTTTLIAPTTTTLTAPTTTLTAPTTTLTAPTTTLIAPTTTLIAPTTTLIAPTTTTIAPTTTVAPATTIQTAPTTTIQTAPTIRTITR
jgi:hypothetical protein